MFQTNQFWRIWLMDFEMLFGWGLIEGIHGDLTFWRIWLMDFDGFIWWWILTGFDCWIWLLDLLDGIYMIVCIHYKSTIKSMFDFEFCWVGWWICWDFMVNCMMNTCCNLMDFMGLWEEMLEGLFDSREFMGLMVEFSRGLRSEWIGKFLYVNLRCLWWESNYFQDLSIL